MKKPMNAFSKTLAGAALLLPGLALADAGNWNYVQGGYQQGEVDDIDVDGWSLEGAIEFNQEFYLTAGILDLELDEEIAGVDLSGEQMNVGIGYVFGENEAGSFFGEVNYFDMEFDARAAGNRFSGDDDGFGLALGTRINLNEEAELYARVDYIDWHDSSSSTIPSIGLLYSFTPQVAGFVDYARDDEERNLGLGLRFYFQ